MKKSLAILLVLGATAMGGCTTTGGNQSLADENKQTIASKISEGKTTRADVVAMFGPPLNKNYDGGNEVAHYVFTTLNPNFTNYIPVVNWFARGVHGTSKNLTIVYDEKGVVKTYSIEESKVGSKTGIQ